MQIGGVFYLAVLWSFIRFVQNCTPFMGVSCNLSEQLEKKNVIFSNTWVMLDILKEHKRNEGRKPIVGLQLSDLIIVFGDISFSV